jgi:hypothetical protein
MPAPRQLRTEIRSDGKMREPDLAYWFSQLWVRLQIQLQAAAVLARGIPQGAFLLCSGVQFSPLALIGHRNRDSANER